MAFIHCDTNCMYIASKDMVTYFPTGILKKGSICKQNTGKVTFCDLETNTEFLIQSRNFHDMIGDKFISDVYDRITEEELQSYVKLLLRERKAGKAFLPIIAVPALISLFLNSDLGTLLGFIAIAAAICSFLICHHILTPKREQIYKRLRFERNNIN